MLDGKPPTHNATLMGRRMPGQRRVRGCGRNRIGAALGRWRAGRGRSPGCHGTTRHLTRWSTAWTGAYGIEPANMPPGAPRRGRRGLPDRPPSSRTTQPRALTGGPRGVTEGFGDAPDVSIGRVAFVYPAP